MAKKASTKKTGKDRKAPRANQKNTPRKTWEKYKVDGDKLTRTNDYSPKSPGNFLANHKNRKTCGATGYTETKSKPKQEE